MHCTAYYTRYDSENENESILQGYLYRQGIQLGVLCMVGMSLPPDAKQLCPCPRLPPINLAAAMHKDPTDEHSRNYESKT